MWYRIEKQFKNQALKRLASLRPRRIRHGAATERIDRILLIRQHDQFGDFLLTTPAIRALRGRFPDAHIDLVVRSYLYPIAKGNPDVDDVLVFHESAFSWKLRDISSFIKLMRQVTDLTIVFNTVSHSLSSDLIAWLSGAPVVMGPASPTFDHIDVNPFYTVSVPMDTEPKHQIQRNLDLVRHVGAETNDYSYTYTMSDEERTRGNKVLERLIGKRQGHVLAVHFGTGDVRKRYPVEKLARVCDRLSAALAVSILVIPAPGEDELFHALHEATSSNLFCAPPTTLRNVAAIIRAADLLVCNDTGVLHLAAAVGTSTLSFHATSDPAYWKPIGSQHRALYAVNQQIEHIPSDLICDEIIAMLEGSYNRTPDSIIRISP